MTAPRVQLDVQPSYPLPLATEITARMAADTALQAQITALAAEVGGGGEGTGGGTTPPLTAMTPYTGQVATNCTVPDHANPYYTQFNSRSRHKMMDDVTQLQVAFPNWNVATSSDPSSTSGYGGIEHTNGLRALIRASIEYPVGTFRALQFSGDFTGTIPPGGTLLSDLCSISIPKGAFFFIRVYWSSPDGGNVIWIANKDPNNGEAYSYGVGGIPDQSRSGTITDGVITNGTTVATANDYVYRPVAIVGPTRKRSIILFGDSRVNNYQDLYTNDTSASRGAYMRSLSDDFAYISTAIGGDRLEWFLADRRRCTALALYCSHIIFEYGINDVDKGVYNATQLVAMLQQAYALLPTGKPIIQATYEPYTSSSDGWTTFAGQTPMAQEATRVAMNTAIRAGVGQAGTIDTAAAFEDGVNSGRWITGQIDGPLTPDGLHENYAGATFFKNRHHIPPSLFTFY